MGIEKDCLKRALEALPDASTTDDQIKRWSYLVPGEVIKDLVFYEGDFGDIDGYAQIRIDFTFEKDPMQKDQKGWRHTLTMIYKHPFVRGY